MVYFSLIALLPFLLGVQAAVLGKRSGSIVVNSTTHVSLSYIDSGPPPSSSTPYTTIVAIHGMIFNNLVFQKMIDAAPSKGVRVVAFNRRPFSGSTPLSPLENNLLMNGGSQAELDQQMEIRGHEIASFIDAFITQNNIPAVTSSGKGGIIILGWSVGAWGPLAAIASTSTLPAAVRSRLGSRIRGTILYEPAPLVVGLPNAADQWTPLQDTSFDASLTLPAFGQHVTAFFDHGDLSKRDPTLLSWVLPSTAHVPTIYTIPPAQQASMVSYGADAQTDLPFLSNFQTQLLNVYRKAWFDPTIAAAFPHMKRSFLTGNTTPAFGITGMWAIQDDAAANPPPSPITFKVITNSNHFLHWVDPKRAIDTFMGLC